LLPPPPRSTLFPYTTLFRSVHLGKASLYLGLPQRLDDGGVQLGDDLARRLRRREQREPSGRHHAGQQLIERRDVGQRRIALRAADRKSTRLNSSHLVISYAV